MRSKKIDNKYKTQPPRGRKRAFGEIVMKKMFLQRRNISRGSGSFGNNKCLICELGQASRLRVLPRRGNDKKSTPKRALSIVLIQ